MWLPTRLYESLPYVYVAGGILLVSGALYVGPGVPLFDFYVAASVISFFSGIAVHVRRRQSRRLSAPSNNSSARD